MTSPDRSRSESRTSPRKLTAKAKQAKALELRKAGFTYQRIADTPTDKAGGNSRPLYASKASAFKAVQKAIAELEEKTAESAHDVLALELSRLDEMHAALWVRAMRGDDKAILAVVRLMERRTSYLGLDFTDGLDERHLAVVEAEAARTQDAFEAALRDQGLGDEEVEEVLGRVAHHLEQAGPASESSGAA